MIYVTRSKSFASCVVMLLIVAPSGCALRRTKYADPEKIAGQINWIARGAASGENLDSGTMTVRVRDIKVTREVSADNKPFFPKRVDLNKNFYFQMAEYPEANPTAITGFGLVILHRRLHTFCWEWFNIDGDKHAIKLQETGEIAFDTQKIGAYWEIIRTEFLTDVEFRVTLYDPEWTRGDPKWRVMILKGSYINWPSLVDDIIRLNN
jgi:hypothetical protein